MKAPSPKNIALLSALFLAILTAILSLLSLSASPNNIYKLISIELLLIFFATYVIVFYTVRKILIDKITPIYKIIQQTGNNNALDEETIDNKNIIEEATKDVAIWARIKTIEIEKLQKLEIYRREFIGNVSHELKTPIFNIQGYISTLLDGGINDPNINHKYLERADRSINRLISIVQDLESISKLESGELELKREDFDIAQLAKEVLENNESFALTKQISFSIKNTIENTYVNADKSKIIDVLNNLIVNSIKYGKQNGHTSIDFFEMGNLMLIEVSDNGIGIEEKYLPRLFERFFRVDKSRSSEQGGTGLGLAIVKHILEVHNQQIHVKSNIGIGSSFSFTLEKSTK